MANPRSVEPSSGQLTALRVLADQWSQEGRASGLWLAERLQGEVSDARREELGFADWWGQADVRQLALSLDPGLVGAAADMAARSDATTSVKLLSWISTHEAGVAMHALVASHVMQMLHQVEQGSLGVARNEGTKFTLENGWQLDVFMRGPELWRIDGLISPEGFTLSLGDFNGGPLGALSEYAPPAHVFGAVHPGRVGRNTD